MNRSSEWIPWYALYCNPHAERSVLKQLQAKGIEGYLPLWQPPSRAGRVPKPKPYFPSYLFVHVNLEVVGISALQYLPGVRHLVFIGGQPARVPLEEIERICTALAWQAQAVTDVSGQSLVKGDPVRITSGPLRGLNAVFESTLSDRERVCLLIHFLSKGAHVKVEREYIEKVRLNEWTRAHLRVS